MIAAYYTAQLIGTDVYGTVQAISHGTVLIGDVA